MPSQSNPLRNRLRVTIVLAVVGTALLLLTYRAYFPQEVKAQEGMQTRSEAGDMECISYCSLTRPGTTLMEVKWRLADRSLNETDLRAKAGQQVLEATVYSEGFDRGLYAVVSAVKPKALFRAPAKAERAAPAVQPQSKLTGLDKLVVADVATRLDKPTHPLRLLWLQAEAPAAEWLAVRLEGLNPGMEYTYRVPGGPSVVACQAAVCPVDKIATPAVPTKPKPSLTPR
jgi:hypothetical protein